MTKTATSTPRAFLTGGTGFIGRLLPAHLISRGYEVHLITRAPARDLTACLGEVGRQCIVHHVDLLDSPTFDFIDRIKPSHLLHLAWYTEPGRYWSSPANLDWVTASLRLVSEFASAGGQRVVVAGTCAEYDWSFPLLVEETTPLAPTTVYGTSKANLHRQLRDTTNSLGISLAWGHIFFPYGPAEKPDRFLAEVITQLLSGCEAHCTDGQQVRDFIHVEDAANAFVTLLDSAVEGAVNIATGVGHSVREVVEMAGRMVGRPELLKFGSKPRPQNDPARLVADVRRLLSDVGFIPHYDLEHGIADTVAWWRNKSGLHPVGSI